MNFTPFPNLFTERLSLRQMNNNDEEEIFLLRSDERVLQYIDIPKAETIDDARKFIDKINGFILNNESILWAISLKNSTTLIGTICFWNIDKENSVAETGYILHPDLQGKGIMQEALQKIIDYGFN
jgi:[ribosomal protein S5]-alanine N-acetyltransferase